MRIELIGILFLLGTVTGFTQQAPTEKRHFFLAFGIEAGGQTGNVFSSSQDEFRGNIISGVFLFPLGIPQLSFGTGIGFASYARIDEYRFTGDIEAEPDGSKLYLHDRFSRKFSYLSVPLRVQYSFNCDCAFLQIGLHPGLLIDREEKQRPIYTETELPIEPFGPEGSFNAAVELGAGFRIYFTDHIRLNLQPSFIRIMFPYYDLYGDEFSYNYLRVIFGVEYAIFKE